MMTGLLPDPDGRWPVAEPPGGPLDPRQEVVTTAHELLELRARQQFDELKAWQKARADRLNEQALTGLMALHPDLEKLRLKPGSVRRYRAEFFKFKQFCAGWNFEGHPVQALPACAGAVQSYLVSEHVAGASYNKLRLISAAIADAHYLHGHRDPTRDILVKAALAYARRNRGQFSRKQQQQQVATDETA
jgi:hypothetical protein